MARSLKSRFVKGVASTGAGTMYQIVAGFSGLMIAVRYVPKADFGLFVLVQVTAAFFASVSEILLESVSVTKAITDATGQKKEKVVNTALTGKAIIVTSFTVLLSLTAICVLRAFGKCGIGGLAPFVPVFYCLMSVDGLLLKILQGYHRYRRTAASQFVNGTVKVALVILFVAVLGWGKTGLLWAFILSYGAGIIYEFISIPGRKRPAMDINIMRFMMSFGFPLGLNNVLTFIFTRVDRFMLAALTGPVGVALYEVASKIPEGGYRLGNAYHAVFFPNMSELVTTDNMKTAAKVLNGSLRMFSFLALGGCLFFVLFSSGIVTTLFSDNYAEAAPGVTLLMLSFCIGFASSILGSSLVALGQSDKPVKINLVDTVINITGNLFLIPVFGFMGAVYATLAARISTAPINYILLRRTGIEVRGVSSFKAFAAFILCAGIHVICGTDALLQGVGVMVLYTVLCVVMKVVTLADIRKIITGFCSKSCVNRKTREGAGT